VTIAALTDAVAAFIAEQDLAEVDAVGSSMGARMVLDLVRGGHRGKVVALAPGGFWSNRELAVFNASLRASISLVRALRPALPALTGNPVTRTALLAQFSARPWALSREVVLPELVGLAAARSTDAALDALTTAPGLAGASGDNGGVTIGWGRRARALAAFPGATLHWFEHCGHFPHWDSPDETAALILRATG
jgi:pimeloyl-ACP methyl ester carboxylesterase